jgi:hypothetical protein
MPIKKTKSKTKTKAKKAAVKKPARLSPADAVTDQLKYYAMRGVFREFSAKPLGKQRAEFRFVWLTSRPIHAVFNAKTNVLKIIDLLPGITPRSPMDRALREFIDARFSKKLPEHRRLSKTVIRELKTTSREESMTLALTLNPRQAGEGARQAVHLVSEIFQSFLAGPYHEYMVRNFDISED